MAERMTDIGLPGLPMGRGYMEYGRKSAEHMIAKLRRIARNDLRAAQAILDAPDEAFRVETFTGIHVQRNREVIQEGQVDR